jgi:hypothetical protein
MEIRRGKGEEREGDGFGVERGIEMETAYAVRYYQYILAKAFVVLLVWGGADVLCLEE